MLLRGIICNINFCDPGRRPLRQAQSVSFFSVLVTEAPDGVRPGQLRNNTRDGMEPQNQSLPPSPLAVKFVESARQTGDKAERRTEAGT